MLKNRVLCEMGWNSDIAVYLRGGDYYVVVSDTRPDVDLPECDEVLGQSVQDIMGLEERYRTAPRVPIGLPHDGVQAVFENATNACEFVVILKSEGYRVPHSVVRELFMYSDYEKLYY